MRSFRPESFAVLRAVSDRPIHHLSLNSQQRREIGQLWLGRLVRLRRGDVWEASDFGRQWLKTTERMH